MARLLAACAVAAAVALSAQSAVAVERVDVNRASAEELAALPGIGEAKAAAIVEERSKRPFTSHADLERVKGIGPGLVADLRDLVKISKKAAD